MGSSRREKGRMGGGIEQKVSIRQMETKAKEIIGLYLSLSKSCGRINEPTVVLHSLLGTA